MTFINGLAVNVWTNSPEAQQFPFRVIGIDDRREKTRSLLIGMLSLPGSTSRHGSDLDLGHMAITQATQSTCATASHRCHEV